MVLPQGAVEGLGLMAASLQASARLPSPSFWRGRRVLLTGHTGFKGAWMALWLRELGAEVTGFALAPDCSPSLFDVADVGQDMASRLGDLRDEESVVRSVEAAAPEIVLHLAAQPIVRRAIFQPVETIATNVLGTAHLLSALRNAPNLRTVLVVTSDKVYANTEQGKPFAEGDRLVPACPAPRTVRAAAPFPAPARMGRVTYTDTWLWDRSGRFQLDTLTEGQK